MRLAPHETGYTGPEYPPEWDREEVEPPACGVVAADVSTRRGLFCPRTPGHHGDHLLRPLP